MNPLDSHARPDPGGPGLMTLHDVSRSPHDTILLDTASIVLGRFDCPVGSAQMWDHDRLCDAAIMAVPWTPVAIRNAGREEFIADPNNVTLYNRGQVFRRRVISPRGDRCVVILMSDSIISDIVRTFDPGAADRGQNVLPFDHAPSGAGDFLDHRRLLERTNDGLADPLETQERCVELVARHVGRAFQLSRTAHEHSVRRRVRADTHGAWRDLAERTKELLAHTFTRSLSLDEIASRVHASPFHLVRVFRVQTSKTIHAYRNELRMREALLRIAEGCDDLASLGLELGYASHSHFTSVFSRAWGSPPSAFRRNRRDAFRAERSGHCATRHDCRRSRTPAVRSA